MFFLPLVFLDLISKETNRYGNEDWVRPSNNPRQQYTEPPNEQDTEETEVPVFDDDNSDDDSDYDDARNYDADSGSEEERYSSDEYDSSESESEAEDSDSDCSSVVPDAPRTTRANNPAKAKPSKRRKILVSCDKAHPQARHRFKGDARASKSQWRTVTPGYVLIFLGVLCVLGGTKLRVAKDFYSTRYNANNPMVQNAMTRDAYV
jgi:hypothetical protein